MQVSYVPQRLTDLKAATDTVPDEPIEETQTNVLEEATEGPPVEETAAETPADAQIEEQTDLDITTNSAQAEEVPSGKVFLFPNGICICWTFHSETLPNHNLGYCNLEMFHSLVPKEGQVTVHPCQRIVL